MKFFTQIYEIVILYYNNYHYYGFSGKSSEICSKIKKIKNSINYNIFKIFCCDLLFC